MKRKYVFAIGFILGAIIFSTVSVFATASFLASQITYKSTTLDVALDDLYDKANNYYPLGTTSATASDILSGKTAYSGNGQIINAII